MALLPWLPHFMQPALRRALLAAAGQLSSEKSLARSRRSAVQVARQAAARSPAYRDLLRLHGLDANRLPGELTLSDLPILTKAMTFERYTLDELAGPVDPRDLADVLTSSGHGGTTFGFRLSKRRKQDQAWFDIDLGLQHAFNVDQRPTLLVNCLPMGVVFPSRAVTVANVSVREDMACAILKSLGPRYAQTIVCTDPLFVRRLLRQAAATGLDWRALNTSLILGEEMLVESQRSYLAQRMGIDLDDGAGRMVASSFGTAELGLNLLFETRETIRLGRALRQNREALGLLGGQADPAAAPALFCHDPTRCHVEAVPAPGDEPAGGAGVLCFTLLDRQAVIPLPRYSSGDVGRIVDPAMAARLAALCGQPRPAFPLVAVWGRAADRAAGALPVEKVKSCIYAIPALADELTGAFRLQRMAQGWRLQLQSTNNELNGNAAYSHFVELKSHLGLDDSELSISLVAEADFPRHGRIDYERKLAYRDTP